MPVAEQRGTDRCSALAFRRCGYRVCRETVMVCSALLQSTGPVGSCVARTLTATPQMFAATLTGTCAVIWLWLTTSVMVTFTRPPVMTGAAEAVVAGTTSAPANVVATRARFTSRFMTFVSLRGFGCSSSRRRPEWLSVARETHPLKRTRAVEVTH